MSITSRINEMSSHIEQAYDELQGLGADLTNVNKNIENISMVLDDIYDSLPSVSGEGTSLTLNDTRVGKIKSTLKGNTSQNGTPTPDTPIPVNVVSGDNSVYICNKNLAILKDYLVPTTPQGISFTYNDDGSISYSGTLATNTYTVFASRINNCLPLGNYVLSINKTVSYRVNLNVFYSDNTESNFYITPGNTSLPFEITKKVVSYSSSFTSMTIGTTYNDTLKIQLEKGSSATSFVKSESEIRPIDLAPNLYDKTTEVSGYINNNGGISSSSYTNSSDYIEVEANKQYTIAWDFNILSITSTREVAYYNTSKTFISRTTGISPSARHYTFTPTQNGYIRFDYDKNAFNIQCYKNESSLELCKIGNYQDYFYKDSGKWYLHKEIKRIVLDGTEAWDLQSINGYGIANFLLNVNDYIGGDDNLGALCDRFTKQTSFISQTQTEGFFLNVAKSLFIRINSTTANTKDIFKTWLSTNNTILYYALATPTTEEISYQPLIDQLNLLEKAQSKENQTNISQVNNDLPFIISASALKEWSV